MAKNAVGPGTGAARPELLRGALERAVACHRVGNFAEAERIYRSVLERAPRQFDALHLLGVIEAQRGNPETAHRLIGKALAINPRSCEALTSRGNVLRNLNRRDEAMASYARALDIDPAYVEALSNRGIVLHELGRLGEALDSFDKVLAIAPNHALALNNRGNVLQDLMRYEEALTSLERALVLRPDYAEALNNRGIVLRNLGHPELAIESFSRALAIRPGYMEAVSNRGNALLDLAHHEEAAQDFERILGADPTFAYAAGRLLQAKTYSCDWRGFDQDCARITADIRTGARSIGPFAHLGISSSAEDLRRCAEIWVQDRFPPARRRVWSGERYDHDRIRIAYVSADFHAHATGYLMAGLFERHDRERFEIIALSLGADEPSPMRVRLKAAFERFIDCRSVPDHAVAGLLRELEIDVIVDLKGFTQDARPGIFALRPAPLQVSYLGFPSTMGAEYIDYILADRVVIPEEHFPFYSEKVVYLPETYQVNDVMRRIAELTPSRFELGLPEHGFVFCCFNNSYKITPGMFEVWMRLLREVEGSVLWLLESNGAVPRNLRREAAARGVSPSRLVFAPFAPMEEHLARQRVADLCLDTLPYNAHTTASDALWVGLPVVTCLGTAFAGRVGASLLQAVGLPELVTHSLKDYAALARKLATDPAALADIRAKLERNRMTHPLFNTDRFRCHIEAAYETMWERHQRGEPPAHFAVEATRSSPLESAAGRS